MTNPFANLSSALASAFTPLNEGTRPDALPERTMCTPVPCPEWTAVEMQARPIGSHALRIEGLGNHHGYAPQEAADQLWKLLNTEAAALRAACRYTPDTIIMVRLPPGAEDPETLQMWDLLRDRALSDDAAGLDIRHGTNPLAQWIRTAIQNLLGLAANAVLCHMHGDCDMWTYIEFSDEIQSGCGGTVLQGISFGPSALDPAVGRYLAAVSPEHIHRAVTAQLALLDVHGRPHECVEPVSGYRWVENSPGDECSTLRLLADMYNVSYPQERDTNVDQKN